MTSGKTYSLNTITFGFRLQFIAIWGNTVESMVQNMDTLGKSKSWDLLRAVGFRIWAETRGYSSIMDYPSLYTWTIWEICAIHQMDLCFLDRVPGSQFRIDAFLRHILIVPLNQKPDLSADVLGSSCQHVPCGQMPNFFLCLYWKETIHLLNWSFFLDVSCALLHMIQTHCATGSQPVWWHPRVPFLITSDGV